MSIRAIVVIAIAIAGALIGLMVALSGDPKPASPAESAGPDPVEEIRSPPPTAPTPSIGGGGPRLAPSRPAKPAVMDTTAGADQPLWQAYDEEQRDPSWAGDKEAAIRDTLDPLIAAANRNRPGAVTVPRVECRERSCRMLIAGGDETAFVGFVESLQDERGFYGDADLLALDGYGETTDKQTGEPVYQVRVHLLWHR